MTYFRYKGWLRACTADPMDRVKELKTREHWEELLQGIDTVLFDCDGQLSCAVVAGDINFSLRCSVDWSRRFRGWGE